MIYDLNRTLIETMIRCAIKKLKAMNEQIQNIAQKKDTLCRMMYN